MDTRTLDRKVNQLKAKVEERRGPAGHSQQDLPILDGIRNVHAEDTVSLAIPAHKSGAGAPEYAKGRARRAGVLGGPDDAERRRQPTRGMGDPDGGAESVAEALEADQCLFSTNGSTTSVHGAMSAVVGPGEKIALSRNAHKSSIKGSRIDSSRLSLALET